MALAAPAPRVLADYVSRTWVMQVVLVVGAAAIVGISAQIIIPLPFTPVPLTLQTFAVLLAGGVLGSTRGALAMIVYLVVGSLGVPWFADGGSGFGGATFGYIVGFIVAASWANSPNPAPPAPCSEPLDSWWWETWSSTQLV
jgi:biotin transport system substrate-specific component